MIGWRMAAVVLGLALLTACTPQQALDNMSSPQERTLSATVIGDLQGGPTRDADLATRLAPELRDQLAPVLPKMRALTPSGPNRLVDGSFQEWTGGQRQARLVYEIDGPGGRNAIVSIAIQSQGGVGQVVNGLYVNPLKGHAEDVGAFRLTDVSAAHYAVLALSILSFVTIVAAWVMLAVTPRVRRKWLWAIGIALAFGQISIDWSTGGLFFNLLNIQLLGAFALKAGMLGAWRVGFGVPVFAIWFLIRRRRIQTPPPDVSEAF